jgi:alpha-beta hydrolase superfamily lysophospholipase
MGLHEEIVQTHSEDGIRLTGVYVRLASTTEPQLAVICIPGLYAAYDDAPYPALARGLAARGYPCIAGDTRGHDFGAVLRYADGRIAPGGGGWERLAHAPLDIAGWIDFAVTRGYARVALLGHSLGARKVAHYQAQRADDRVAAVITASPVAREIGAPDPEILALAERMVAKGRGMDLLPWPPVGCSMSAQTYLDHEAPGTLYRHVFWSHDDDPLVVGIRCPILALYGGAERVDERDRTPELETIRRYARASARVDTLLIPGADHGYTAREDDVATAVAAWLDAIR